MTPTAKPFSHDLFVNWAVMLLAVLAAALLMAIFSPTSVSLPVREQSEFKLSCVSVGDADFDAAFPRAMRQSLPAELDERIDNGATLSQEAAQ